MGPLNLLQLIVQGPLQAPAPAYSVVAEPPVQNPKSDNAVETGQAQPQASFLQETTPGHTTPQDAEAD